MIFDYAAVAQDTANKTVSETFYRDVYASICMRIYFSIFNLLNLYQSMCVLTVLVLNSL